MDDRGVVLGSAFVVADGAPAAGEPGQGSFNDDPSAGQDGEADLPGEFADDLDADPVGGRGEADELICARPGEQLRAELGEAATAPSATDRSLTRQTRGSRQIRMATVV